MSDTLCPHCNAAITPTARFCARCGKPLAGAQAAPVPATPAVPAPPAQTTLATPDAALPAHQQATMAHHDAAPPDTAPAGNPATMVLGEAPAPGTLVVRWMGGDVQQHPLAKSTLNIGRSPDSDVVINHPAVSGRHLCLTLRPDGMTIVDLHSTNGTLHNGQRLTPGQPQPIQFADVVRIGDLNGNWVTLGLESAAGDDLRAVALGSLDLTQVTSAAIGRDPGCALTLDHPTVSFRHALLFNQPDGLLLRDLNSTNGTFVNRQRVRQALLKSGDEIQIGPYSLVYDARAMRLAPSMPLGHRIDALRLGREVAAKRMILRNISLTIKPGEFVALVGGSGTGKSTLMKAMNGYDPATHGHLLMDGEPLYPRLELYRTQMGYVPQDDIIHRGLPVKTALYYAARLRLPDARPAEIEQRITDALAAVDMDMHADKPVSVLSGGQRKRVSIAVELLARPTLFFLDEPTSGLDPGLEKKMMYDLNRLADEGRTVVLVTHATANIEQCDQVAFLSQGRLAYYGPPAQALQFFGVRDFADIYLKLAQEIDPANGQPVPAELQPYYHPKPDSVTRTVAGVLWAEHYTRSAQYKRFVAERQKDLHGGQAATIGAAPQRRANDSFLRQMFILAQRQLDLIRFDWRTLAILLLMAPLIAALFAAVSDRHDLTGMPGTQLEIAQSLRDQVAERIAAWESMPLSERPRLKDYTGLKHLPVENAQILITMFALALTQAGTFVAAYEIVKERAIFRRERAVNLSIRAYVLSKLLVLSGFAVFQVLAAMGIIALVVDMDFSGALLPSGFLEMFITLLIAMLAATSFGLFISAIVPNTDVVLYAILIQLFAQIILGGVLFPLNSKLPATLTISYWTTDALGATVDMPRLNAQGHVCSAIESFNEPGQPGTGIKRTPVCSPAEADLLLTYRHDAAFVVSRWVGLGVHALLWFLLTMIVQARKKGE